MDIDIYNDMGTARDRDTVVDTGIKTSTDIYIHIYIYIVQQYLLEIGFKDL